MAERGQVLRELAAEGKAWFLSLCLSSSGGGAPMNVSKPTVKRWKNVNDTLSVVVGVIVVVLFLIASIKVISYLAFAEATVDRYMSKNCSELAQSGLEARWEYGKGCLVNIDGHWVPERKVPK